MRAFLFLVMFLGACGGDSGGNNNNAAVPEEEKEEEEKGEKEEEARGDECGSKEQKALFVEGLHKDVFLGMSITAWKELYAEEAMEHSKSSQDVEYYKETVGENNIETITYTFNPSEPLQLTAISIRYDSGYDAYDIIEEAMGEEPTYSSTNTWIKTLVGELWWYAYNSPSNKISYFIELQEGDSLTELKCFPGD